jgi:hypothetical protein
VDDLVRVSLVRSEAEAVALGGLLESAGIESMHRLTNMGAGAVDGWSPSAPRELLVRAEDAERARGILAGISE